MLKIYDKFNLRQGNHSHNFVVVEGSNESVHIVAEDLRVITYRSLEELNRIAQETGWDYVILFGDN